MLAGPYAAMTLGDLGADVIKVERPGAGDDTRTWGPPWVDGVATYYTALNRNKRSVTFDLTDERDLALAVELAARADVLIENFRPGTLERYGLGYDQVRAINPRVIYCSITGFGGATEEAAELSGYDLLVQAMSGIMSVTGQPDGEPTKVGVAVVDHVTALQSTIGILAALQARHVTGVGQHVEVSLMGSALAALINQGSAHVGAGVVPKRLGNRHPSVAPYQPFPSSDGWFIVACGNDRQFAKVAAAVGRPDLVTDARFATNAARITNLDELEAVLSEVFSTKDSATWIAQLSAGGVPAGPINDIGQAFADATRLGIAPVVTTTVGNRVERTVRSPIGLSDTPVSVRGISPELGEHDVQVREWLTAPRASAG
ncbi:MAG: hypothetical protein JWN39_3403 [Ilumatobacteraceae bacterium]|nr:hypothetical protein [Ilumatobacteraceae bacterium]